MKYGIVIFPSKKLQDLANSYRKRYDPHYSLIPPHLTLRSPFEAEERELDEISSKLLEISKNTSLLELNVYKFSSFSPVNNVVYLKVEQTDALLYLNETLHKEIKPAEPEYAFIPHITIGQKLSDSEHTDVFSSLKLSDISHQERVDRFHLLYQLENGSWTVFETYRLGKDC
ncbi:YjcG family protein [Bacillus carboniphilus]|uniref:Putative phosphoesterase LC087_01800 n=1 Tax=Bacillus carboniphilus TaxID=86663 RepID=A0ABY9JUA8_9BACI|nr:YjcG family protein [Bacillus carboniphilus]WLR42979.1 YjcG family protein [Bacillus carboniphilus]